MLLRIATNQQKVNTVFCLFSAAAGKDDSGNGDEEKDDEGAVGGDEEQPKEKKVSRKELKKLKKKVYTLNNSILHECSLYEDLMCALFFFLGRVSS